MEMMGLRRLEIGNWASWKSGGFHIFRLNIEPSIEVDWGMSYLFDQNSSLQRDHNVFG